MTETVDACIIAALETKLAEAEKDRDAWRWFAESNLEAIKRLDARLATAHDALHDCGFLGGQRP